MSSGGMRSVHFRVDDDLLTCASSGGSRGAGPVRCRLCAWWQRSPGRSWGVRRGAPWADVEAWEHALDIIQEVENRDITARAKLASERRTMLTFQEKLERERNKAQGIGSD